MPRPVPLSKIKVSVKPMPVRGAVVGLMRVTDITDEEPPVTLNGEKALTTLMLSGVTVSVAFAAAVLEIDTAGLGGYVTVPVTDPTARVFVLFPAVVASTSTLTVQMPLTVPTLAGTIPPLIVISCVPEVAVTEPVPQVVTRFSGDATDNPTGSVSVNAVPVRGTVLALSRVIVRVDLPFWLTVEG